jgi:hypothetical protein
MRILMALVLACVSLAAAPKRPEVPKRKAPVRQSTSKGAAAARAKANKAAGKGNKPALAGRKAKNPPKRPKVYHK